MNSAQLLAICAGAGKAVYLTFHTPRRPRGQTARLAGARSPSGRICTAKPHALGWQITATFDPAALYDFALQVRAAERALADSDSDSAADADADSDAARSAEAPRRCYWILEGADALLIPMCGGCAIEGVTGCTCDVPESRLEAAERGRAEAEKQVERLRATAARRDEQQAKSWNLHRRTRERLHQLEAEQIVRPIRPPQAPPSDRSA
jgi:hypothetical protein